MRIPIAALLALSLALTSPALAESGNGAAPPSLDIYNFGQVDPTYFRGAQPDEQGVAALARAGVKMVIDLQRDGRRDEPRLVEAAGMKYVKIPMTTQVAPTPEQLEWFLSLVSNPENLPVYVHCREGRHRTGVMTAVYRMTKDGWTADRAYDEMKDYKFGWSFLHRTFKRFVYAFTPSPTAVALWESGAGPVTP